MGWPVDLTGRPVGRPMRCPVPKGTCVYADVFSFTFVVFRGGDPVWISVRQQRSAHETYIPTTVRTTPTIPLHQRIGRMTSVPTVDHNLLVPAATPVAAAPAAAAATPGAAAIHAAATPDVDISSEESKYNVSTTAVIG